MSDVHQSYEDFRLDALLQYDLADDEEEGDVQDSESVHSGIVDDATFDELYTSIHDDMCYDDDGGRRKLMDVTKRLRKPQSRRIIPSLKRYDEKEEISKSPSLLRTVSVLFRPKRGKSNRIISKGDKQQNQRGIERNISNRTDWTASVTSLDEVAFDADPSNSVCYLDEEGDEDINGGLSTDHEKLNHRSSNSFSSEVFADDDSVNDYQKTGCRDDVSLASCGGVLVDECYTVLLGNNSMDSAISVDIDSDEEDISDKMFRTDDPLLNRSLPIIESRGLQDLFFDDYERTEDLADRCHRSVLSTATGASSRRCRPYTISDF